MEKINGNSASSLLNRSSSFSLGDLTVAWSTPSAERGTEINLSPQWRGINLPPMAVIIALEFCVIFFIILRRKMPLETAHAMFAVRSKVFSVVWLGLYLIAELAPLNLQLVCLILLAFAFGFALTLCSRFGSGEHETLTHRCAFVRPLASRAPPVI